MFYIMYYSFSLLSDLSSLSQASAAVNDEELDPLAAQAYDRRIQKLERDNKELEKRLQGICVPLVSCMTTILQFKPVFIYIIY